MMNAKPLILQPNNTLLEDSYKGFVRSGALLPDDKKERLRGNFARTFNPVPRFHAKCQQISGGF